MSLTDVVFLFIMFPWSAAIFLTYTQFRRIRVMRESNKLKGNGRKKTSIGKGKFTKWGNKDGGQGGSTTSKTYRKKPRGQG